MTWSGTSGTPVGAVVPTGFEKYARVFHPARSRSDVQRALRWSEIAAWAGRVVHPEMQWEAISRPAGRPMSQRPWGEEPDIGYCPEDVIRPLIEILREHTATPDRCWVCVWTGWGGLGEAFPDVPQLMLPHREHLLLVAPIEVLLEDIFQGPAAMHVGPGLWWPDDRTWCVATEIDFRWTYVGGSTLCIERILADHRLEALRTKPEHRGDYLSDTLNGPVAP